MRRLARTACLALLSCGAVSPADAADPADCSSDAIFVLDASGSMASIDITGNVTRIVRIREAAREVVPRVAAVRNLGLMVYGPGPGPLNDCKNVELKVEPAPNNGKVIVKAIENVIPNGRTPLTQAVREAAEALRFREKPTVVVLLTDGEENCGQDPCALARQLEAEGKDLTVHVIDYKLRNFATWQGTQTSRCLANLTGGLYIEADTAGQLTAAMNKTLDCPRVTEVPDGASTVRQRLAGSLARCDARQTFACSAPQ